MEFKTVIIRIYIAVLSEKHPHRACFCHWWYGSGDVAMLAVRSGKEHPTSRLQVRGVVAVIKGGGGEKRMLAC